MNYQKKFRVKPGSRVKLKDFDPRFAEKCGSKRSALPKIAKLQQRMDELQFQLYAEQKRSVLICSAGSRRGWKGRRGSACHRFNESAELPRG